MNLKILWIFYRKLLIPGVLFSLLLSFMTGFSLQNFSLCFVLIFPLLHFYIYEMRLKTEYIFYANFGFSKIFLWIFTVVFGLTVKIIAKFL